MFFKLTAKIPNRVYVAYSGGPDSWFALNFCSKSRRREVVAVHINHSTKSSSEFQLHAQKECSRMKIPLEIFHVGFPQPGSSAESFWSRERAKIFNSLDAPVVTGHNLDDAVEWWLMRAMLGMQPSLIRPVSGNVIRPFLRFSKQDILSSIADKSVFIIDPTNVSGNLRAKIRNGLVDDIDDLTSIRSVIRKKYDIN